MSRVPLSEALLKSNIPHNIAWADRVIINLPDDYLPFPHQYEGANLVCTYDRAGLFDAAGTGKTLSLHINALYRVGTGNRVLCLMPPVLLKQFYQEMVDKFENVLDYIEMEIFRGTVKQREKLAERYNEEGWPDILLMTYDLFRGNKPVMRKKKVIKPATGYFNTLKKLNYSVLITDESQALRNTQSRVHKKVFNYIGGADTDKAEAALVLSTATPSHTHVEQCYGLIKLITPQAYSNKGHFERCHIDWNPHSPYKEILGYRDLEIMQANLYAQARRVEKSDVAKDMPPKIHTIVPLELSSTHMKLYKKLLNERLLELEDKLIDVTQDSALRQTALQLISHPNDYSDIHIENVLEEWIFAQLEAIDLELTKVFILIHFNKTADRLVELLKQYNPVTLNSKTANKDKSKEAFLTDDNCRICIAHPLSGGAGSNFQSVCSDVIFYECPDSPGDVIQAEERVHRIVGTDNTVNIYFPCPIGTLAEKKIRSAVDKDAFINVVVGDRKALMSDLFGEED